MQKSSPLWASFFLAYRALFMISSRNFRFTSHRRPTNERSCPSHLPSPLLSRSHSHNWPHNVRNVHYTPPPPLLSIYRFVPAFLAVNLCFNTLNPIPPPNKDITTKRDTEMGTST